MTHPAFFNDPNRFSPLPAPSPGDWLAVHPEEHQRFEAYRASAPLKPSANRKVIDVQPLPAAVEKDPLGVDLIARFVSCYFMLPVRCHRALQDATLTQLRQRVSDETGAPQLLTSDILRTLCYERPEDSLCMLAITTKDLWPGGGWRCSPCGSAR